MHAGIWWMCVSGEMISANNSVLSLGIVIPLVLHAYSFISDRRHIISSIASIIK